MRGVDVDDVKTGFPGTQCRLPMPAAEIADVLPIHGPGLIWLAVQVWHATDAQCYFPRQQVGAASATGP